MKVLSNKWTTRIMLVILITTVLIPGIYAKEKNQEFRVFLHFDDNYAGVYKYAYPVMKEYGYPGTVFIHTNTIDYPNKNSLDQLKEMKDDGWEFASHSRTHPDLRKLNMADLYDEIIGSRNYLIACGLTTKETSVFGSPHTVWNDYVESLVEINYETARTDKIIYFGSEEQPYQRDMVMLKHTSLDQIEYWLQRGRNHNTWLLFIFHEIGEGGNKYYFHPYKFRKVIELIEKYQPKVSTIHDAIVEWEELNEEKPTY